MGILAELMEKGGSFEGIPGITTGVVKENWNKDFPGKVKVELILGEEGKSVMGWVPVMSQYSGDGYGFYTLPEVGTEVVAAFNMGDSGCPVIIGSLWNNKNKLPPDTANEKNTVKRFRTKGGCEIVFKDEEKKTGICLTTPGALVISIDDEKNIVQIHDKEGENAVTINSEAGTLSLKAKNKLELCVGGKAALTLDAGSKAVKIISDQIHVEASQALKLKGQNAGIEGAMMNVKAQSSLKLESGGMAEVKGAMVKIN